MEGSSGFLEQLTAALDKRANWLQVTEIPRLRDAMTTYATQFENAMGMIIRKGLLREDPYNYDQSIGDIVVPSDTPLPEFESADEVSYRLAGYRRQLKYIVSEQEFSLSSLKLARLKKISSLFTYINWQEFGDASSSPTTRAFARSFMKVRMGSDTMAGQILKDTETQIEKSFREVRGIIAEVAAYHREAWKAEVRRLVLPHVPADLLSAPSKREEALRAMRRVFGQEMGTTPWYPALAQEVISEEVEVDGAARRESLLSSLAVPETTPIRKPRAPVAGKQVLLEAVRILCRPHEEMVTAAESLAETERLLQARQGGLRAFLRRLFGRAPRESPDSHTYKIQYTEPATAAVKSETVNFPPFAEEVKKKATLFASIASGNGPAWRRVEAGTEGQIVAFLEKQLNEGLLIHRRLAGLNALFQARAVQAGKTGVRGIKLELLALRNALVKANQRRHEYGENAEEATDGGLSNADAPAAESSRA